MVARGGRVFTFGVTMIVVVMLIYLSSQGVLGPFENVVSVPLNAVQSVVGRASRGISGFIDDVSEYRRLRKRNQDLEEALAIYQAEVAQLREKGEDYDRLADLLDYNRFAPEDQEFVTCDVIGMDTTGFVNAIQINCGRRDGIERLDPVVTKMGLVGRVESVSATGAEILMIMDPRSSVNARLQSTREDGLVEGQLTGDLLMTTIPLDAGVLEGDLVLSNGLGQTLPADLVVGQVLGVSLSENELHQEARVRSLVDFDRLEIVQVIINFEPVDLSVFAEDEEAAP
ncbi:MAG: rod shape-determining protein MreC [Anaerolineae bacterium]|nr:rod shape-determining protein MreC [Anaerolineae bacterium]